MLNSLGLSELFVIALFALFVLDAKKVGELLNWFRRTRKKFMDLKYGLEDELHRHLDLNQIMDKNTMPRLGLQKQGELRQVLVAKIEGLTEQQKIEESQKISVLLADWALFQEAKCIVVYEPSAAYVDISGWIADFEILGKEFFVPVFQEGEAQFQFKKMESLDKELGGEGVVPKLYSAMELEAMGPELILVPGYGFCKDRYRIGGGQGLYNRWLRSLPTCIKLGVCYRAGFGVESFATDFLDVKMDYVMGPDQMI
jgi:5,10-methenyltetrahydrofolate synthetase